MQGTISPLPCWPGACGVRGGREALLWRCGGRQRGISLKSEARGWRDRDILGAETSINNPTRLFEPWGSSLWAVESLSLTSATITGCGDWPAAVAEAAAFSHRAGRGLGAHHSSRNYSQSFAPLPDFVE